MNRRLKEIDPYKAYKYWYEGTGPFCCFFRTTNFVTLKHYPDFIMEPVPKAASETTVQILEQVEKLDTANTLIFIDLSAEQAIEAAFWLKRDKGIQGVLTFNNILHPYGLIGNRKFISYLLQFGELCKNSETRGYAFVLDQCRYGGYEEDDFKNNFNNQYELSEEDLPSFEMLNELGFTSILYIHSGELKEDISPYLDYLHENKIGVLKVDLSSI